MYISSLILQGFKSFGKRTTLTFGEGITAVVGPNGCGKTNIVDALRWVLGEQKQSVLRSSRSEDVIFHGSRSLKPSGLSEVTLTIHNNRATLPIEYNDVEISRRYYRDGESEFLINRNPCRLKDIHELFMDTGMASDAYSVIELKMIEAILSDVEDDRRRMFEEAAGINKYKKQRRSTQMKLEATRQDLERVNDIIGEVDSQVRSLRLQLKRFERHKNLSTELKSGEMILAQLQLKQIFDQQAPLQETLATGKDSHDTEAALLTRDEQQLEELQSILKQGEGDFEQAQQELKGVVSELNEAKEQQLIWGEQLRSRNANLERFQRERETEIQRREELEKEIAGAEKDLLAMVPDLDKKQDAFEAHRRDEESVTSEYQKTEQHYQATRERKFHHRNLIQQEETRQQRTEEMVREKQLELDQLHQSITDKSEQLAVMDRQKKELEQRRSELNKNIKTLEQKQDGNTGKIRDLDELESGRKDRIQQLTTESQVLQSRLDIYTELVASHEGYPSGTREILTHPEQFTGIKGTVAELIKVQPEHATAIDIALGPFATCLVTETKGQADQIISHARKHKLGQLSVIPLDKVSESGAGANESAPGKPLIDLIDVPEEYRALYTRLLAGFTWIEEGGAPEVEIPSGVRVITPEGDLFGDIQVFTHAGHGQGGQVGTSAGSLIVGRTNEIEQLRATLADMKHELTTLEKELSELQQQRSQLLTDQKTVEEEKTVLHAELDKNGSEYTQAEYEWQRTSDDLSDSKARIPAIEEIIRGLEESLTAHHKVIEHLQEQEATIDQDITSAESVYQEVRARRDQWQKELQDLRVELLTLESQRENLASRKLSLEDAKEIAGKRILELEQESTQTQQAIEKLTKDLSDIEGRRSKLEKQISDHGEVVARAEAAVKAQREQTSQLQEQIRQRHHSRETSMAQQQELELQLLDYTKQEELIRARIRDVYHEEIDPETEVDEDTDTVSLQVEIDKLQASIDRIGPINMTVAQEYEEESKRLQFLTEQRDDLLEAEGSLTESIKRIDEQARRQFRETYDKIRHHFKQTFHLFFEGGEGDLRLVGDPDPLESVIEIIAQPPGKKTRSLRALSGGEKALTAIALLFAIYMVKPSPFCILDEVDAPLDDVNIEKFANVINQFSTDTQFIIVTHNKMTMQNADYLYGVTMSEEGLSNIVSVDLSEYSN
ncbi:chromosome segregation protein SMC [Candidatus Neomarinimicrobiota bacterium]